MKGQRVDALLAYRLAIRLAGQRVPHTQRTEWLAEWNTELWYAAAAVPPRTIPKLVRHRAILAFCRGALADAHCMQQIHSAAPARQPRTARGISPFAIRSGPACIAALAMATLLTATLAAALPGTRSAMAHALHSSDLDGTVVILPAGARDESSPALSLRTVRSWGRRPQHLFSGFAFAQPVRKAVHLRQHHSPELTVVRASANLFTLLDLPVTQEIQSQDDALPRLVLTTRLWHQQFAERPEIFGRTIRVGLQPAVVAGVVADEALPPALAHTDAVLLLPESLAAHIADNVRVVAFGRVAPDIGVAATHDPSWHLSVPSAADGETDFTCIAPSVNETTPWHIFTFTLALALLALPAITSVSLGDYQRHASSAGDCTPRLRCRRWLFLALKTPLALATAFFVSLDLAYAIPFASRNIPQYILLVAGFTSTLFALQWIIRDQRSRCPACLRVLTCPARVGRPSRNFLDWNGTELICNGGHGLLHVPDLPTSWFSHPRWLELDPSWSSLFARPV